MEDKKKRKKLEGDSRTGIQTEVETGVGVKKPSSISNLPQEILWEILGNVDSENLIACRLVSWNWNVIASETCRSRSGSTDSSDSLEVQLNCFKFNPTRRGGNKRPGKRSLGNFLNVFGNSNSNSHTHKNFPYSRFHCHVDEESTFAEGQEEEWTEFIRDFGEQIKSLKLSIIYYSTFGLRRVEGRLRDLLLTQLPNLQELGIRTKIITTAMQLSVWRGKVVPSGGLPNLKALYFDSYLSSGLSPIVRDILRASPNLQTISTFDKDKSFVNPPEVYRFLKSRGKLECLRDAEMKLSPNFLSWMRENQLMAASSFKLRALKLEAQLIRSDTSAHQEATLFLTNLFESSKDTLKELNVEPLAFLQQLQLPQLSKLTNLTITKTEDTINMNMNGFLPSEINLLDVFPVLKNLELEISWTTVFSPDDSASHFPNLKTLKIAAGGVNKTIIAQISIGCPNLKNFSIDDKEEPIDNFPEVGKAIWTHMKQLESLKLRISVNSPANAFPAIDSCITGLSGENCIKLYDLNNKTATKLEKIPQSLKVEAERENASILDLKALRNLTLELTPSKICACRGPSRTMMSKAMTFISEDYALKLLDNLTYKIERANVNV